MSRRRAGARRRAPGEATLRLVCSRGGHRLYRIATVRVLPWPDGGYRVAVEYVHLDDEERAESDQLREGADPHVTRRFVCRECGDNLPLKDDNLGRLAMRLHAMGVSHPLELADLR